MLTTPNPDLFALVTGASRGIGECFARALAARGRNVVLVARSKDELDALAAQLSEAHEIRVETFEVDLSVAGAAARLCGGLAERGIEVDLLVNNAALGDHGEFLDLASDRQADVIRVNVLSLVELTRGLLPAMTERGQGAIVNVSSTTCFMPMPSFAVYAATKAFVTSFSLALAEEVRSLGIGVVTLCPGPTRSRSHTDADFRSKIPPQPAEDLVEIALRAVDNQGGLVVPRLINKVMALGARVLPPQVSAKVAGRAMRPRQS